MPWRISRCKRCGTPIVAEFLPPEDVNRRIHRVFRTYDEAVAWDAMAHRVLVEELPNFPLDDDDRFNILPDLKFFRTPPRCPKRPDKVCED